MRGSAPGVFAKGLPGAADPSAGFKRKIFPCWTAKILRRGALELLASRDVEHAVIAEHDRAAVVIGSAVFRIFVEDLFAPSDCRQRRH